jgi:hypothetical protein
MPKTQTQTVNEQLQQVIAERDAMKAFIEKLLNKGTWFNSALYFDGGVNGHPIRDAVDGHDLENEAMRLVGRS